jgi:phosphatidylglycerophosphatase A
MAKVIDALATWFYLGTLSPGPGTWGTLGAVPLILALKALGPFSYLAGVLVLSVLAMVIAHLYERAHGGHDHKEIVIDEVAGFAVAMTWLPMTWEAWAAGFALFRLVDILKPPPVSWLDRKIPGGVGVVADDLGAGILVNAFMQFLFVNTSWLGYQLPP